MTKKRQLNLRQYWDAVGTDNVKKVIEAIDTSMSYARLLRYGIKTPGRQFTLRFIDAAREITPGWEPDLELMLRGVPNSSNGSGGHKLIQPSKEFLRSQSRRSAASQ